MQIFVVDSFIVVKWLHREDEEYLDQADKVLEDALKVDIDLIAPELAKYEVGNALLLKKKLSLDEVKVPIASLYSLPIQFVSMSEDVANETYKIAQEAKITYYDASFMSLAKQYDATLITDNIKHQGKDTSIKVVQLKDY